MSLRATSDRTENEPAVHPRHEAQWKLTFQVGLLSICTELDADWWMPVDFSVADIIRNIILLVPS